jgi:hypothetical protein
MRKLLYILIGFVPLTSCENRRGELMDETSKEAAVEAVNSASFYDHIFTLTKKTVDEIEIDEQLKIGQASFVADPCADVVYYLSQDLSYVENITISYNDFSCSQVGRRRIGKIHVFLTGLISEEGTIATVTMQDFYLEHHKIEGTQISTNKNVTGAVWEFDQKVDNGKITFPSGDFSLWESKKNTEINFLTKQYIQTSSSSGINSEGIEFEIETITPLEKSFSCDYIQKGSILIELEDYNDMLIDYGNGTCDDQATVTIDDDEYKSFDITIN